MVSGRPNLVLAQVQVFGPWASGIISESLRKILRLMTLLRMTRSKIGRMVRVSQARTGIQVVLRNMVTSPQY